MEWLMKVVSVVVVVTVVVALIAVLKQTWRKRGVSNPEADDLLYRKRRELLSPAERSFFGVLEQAVAGDLRVHVKVRVADVLQPRLTSSRSLWRQAFNKISSKHFDYVLCHSTTLEVVAAVELNDRSHAQSPRRERDRFLLHACASAGLVLIVFDAKAKYSMTEVRSRLAAVK